MPETARGNLKLYYEAHGEGEPLVLIRGLGSNADHWYAQAPVLSGHWQVIVFDNRGIARSRDPGGAFTIADMASDTVALMDDLGIPEAHVLGLSMGGMIAQELAVSHPGRVRSLILAATHCGGAQAIKPSEEVAGAIGRVASENSEQARLASLPVFFAPRTLNEKQQVIQDYAAVSMRHPAGPEILTRQMAAIARHDTCGRLSRITAPTLVITGAEDVLVPPGNARILADRIPGAELRVIPECGHQVLIEAPEASNQAIIEFLQQVESNGR
jgi:pimeloyl-ACP methyl ester carboxylesterase